MNKEIFDIEIANLIKNLGDYSGKPVKYGMDDDLVAFSKGQATAIAAHLASLRPIDLSDFNTPSKIEGVGAEAEHLEFRNLKKIEVPVVDKEEKFSPYLLSCNLSIRKDNKLELVVTPRDESKLVTTFQNMPDFLDVTIEDLQYKVLSEYFATIKGNDNAAVKIWEETVASPISKEELNSDLLKKLLHKFEQQVAANETPINKNIEDFMTEALEQKGFIANQVKKGDTQQGGSKRVKRKVVVSSTKEADEDKVKTIIQVTSNYQSDKSISAKKHSSYTKYISRMNFELLRKCNTTTMLQKLLENRCLDNTEKDYLTNYLNTNPKEYNIENDLQQNMNLRKGFQKLRSAIKFLFLKESQEIKLLDSSKNEDELKECLKECKKGEDIEEVLKNNFILNAAFKQLITKLKTSSNAREDYGFYSTALEAIDEAINMEEKIEYMKEHSEEYDASKIRKESDQELQEAMKKEDHDLFYKGQRKVYYLEDQGINLKKALAKKNELSTDEANKYLDLVSKALKKAQEDTKSVLLDFKPENITCKSTEGVLVFTAIDLDGVVKEGAEFPASNEKIDYSRLPYDDSKPPLDDGRWLNTVFSNPETINGGRAHYVLSLPGLIFTFSEILKKALPQNSQEIETYMVYAHKQIEEMVKNGGLDNKDEKKYLDIDSVNKFSKFILACYSMEENSSYLTPYLQEVNLELADEGTIEVFTSYKKKVKDKPQNAFTYFMLFESIEKAFTSVKVTNSSEEKDKLREFCFNNIALLEKYGLDVSVKVFNMLDVADTELEKEFIKQDKSREFCFNNIALLEKYGIDVSEKVFKMLDVADTQPEKEFIKQDKFIEFCFNNIDLLEKYGIDVSEKVFEMSDEDNTELENEFIKQDLIKHVTERTNKVRRERSPIFRSKKSRREVNSNSKENSNHDSTHGKLIEEITDMRSLTPKTATRYKEQLSTKGRTALLSEINKNSDSTDTEFSSVLTKASNFITASITKLKQQVKGSQADPTASKKGTSSFEKKNNP